MTLKSRSVRFQRTGLWWGLRAGGWGQDRPAAKRSRRGEAEAPMKVCHGPSFSLRGLGCGGGTRLSAVAEGQLQRVILVTLSLNRPPFCTIKHIISSFLPEHFLEHATCFLSQPISMCFLCEEISSLDSSFFRSHFLRVLPWPSSLSKVFPGSLPSLFLIPL